MIRMEGFLSALAAGEGLRFLGSVPARPSEDEFLSQFAQAQSKDFQSWTGGGCQAGMDWLLRNAQKRADADAVMPGTKAVLVFAMPFQNPESSGEDDAALFSTGADRGSLLGGELASYANGRDYHTVFRRKLQAIQAALGAEVLESTFRVLIDANPLSERFFAGLTGAGFIGRNTMLILPGLGSRFFLGTVLVAGTGGRVLAQALSGSGQDSRNMVRHPGQGCPPGCRKCIDACPTGALRLGGSGTGQLDSRLCLSWQTIESGCGIATDLRPANGFRIFGCESCIDACPFNQAVPQRKVLDLGKLLCLDSQALFNNKFAGTSVMRAGWRQFLANVCVACGNTGNPEYLPRLLELGRHPDHLVSTHASWAVDRINGFSG